MTKPICQYGKNCFRQNSNHFVEYVHEHLDKIINETTPDDIEHYNFPDDLLMNKDIILEQITTIRNFGTKSSDVNKNVSLIESNKNVLPSESNKDVLTPEILIDRKPDITSLQRTIYNLDRPSCSNAINQEFEDISVNQGPLSLVDRSPTIKIEPNNEFQIFRPQNMAEKMVAASPYNYFLTAIESSPETGTEPLTVTFQELFDSSLGDLECSVQINFTVEPQWLFNQYNLAGQLNKPLLILFGSSTPMMNDASLYMPNVKTHFIHMKNAFGTHHTKMMLFGYKDKSMRVIVSTANLYAEDWRNHTQGLWISEKLPFVSNPMQYEKSESRTGFRKDLISYLSVYNISDLNPWIVRIRGTDFSSINVFLLTSIPGVHHDTYGLAQINRLLTDHTAKIKRNAPIVAQCSTMGSLKYWLTNDFIKSFQCHSHQSGQEVAPDFKLIYPSFENVLNSYDGLMGAGCLLYGSELHEKQTWVMKYLYQWNADCRFRSKAMPHAKTYARWSDKKLFWFVLTSANLSKSAWGSFQRNNRKQIRINNYEAGVLFLPKFVTNTEYFSMDASDQTTPVFPMLYDIPLTEYIEGDVPYLKEYLFET